jgi:2-polyprenyl-3-methyl-5-hydroxy-6-metoxy-1,4-benzoquinol methylase
MKESEIRPQALFNRYLELSRQDIARFFSNQSQFVEVPCPACESDAREAGFDKLGFKYVICKGCESLYLSPRPTSNMIDSYYRESEAVKFWETNFFRETAEARREKMFKPRADLAAEWADRFGVDHGVTLMDVGCGYGIFLEEVARLGRFEQAIGVELAPNLASVCRTKGFHIIEKPIEEIGEAEVSAAVVTAFEVLEHVHDPSAFLGGIRRAIEPGGILLLTTLTVTGFDIQVLWEHSKSVYPPHHINLLSTKGICELIDRNGFDVVEAVTPGELDVDIVRNMVNAQPEIEIPRFVRQMVNSPDDVRTDFQGFLRRNGMSSHMRVIGRRRGKQTR